MLNFAPHHFDNHKFWQTSNFRGIRFVNKLFIKLVNSISISNQNLNGKVEITSFSKQLVQRSQNSQQTKNKLNIAFDSGFYFKWKGLRGSEWWHCLSHKDLFTRIAPNASNKLQLKVKQAMKVCLLHRV